MRGHGNNQKTPWQPLRPGAYRGLLGRNTRLLPARPAAGLATVRVSGAVAVPFTLLVNQADGEGCYPSHHCHDRRRPVHAIGKGRAGRPTSNRPGVISAT